ncbi:MAG: hypothetical protein GY941_17845 [Planctomycetes bacterium]|nr:hypothetical protein [Planctomycetota bacterium]
MREIKFRAYDKIKNKMFTKVTVGNTCNGNHDDYTAHAYYDDDWLHFDELSDVELMQYTGLKDKNCVDVYVGDIVKFNKYIAEIEFPKNEFQPLFYNDYLEEWSSLTFFKGYENFEVIGNIYENPELIK